MLVVIHLKLTNTLYNQQGDEKSPIINAVGVHVRHIESSVKLPKFHKMCNFVTFNVAYCFRTSWYA
jgi:hypothetical protein